MKKLILFACLALTPCILFAQSKNADTSATKTNKLSPSSLKIADGAAMLPANDIITNISRSKELNTFYNAIQVAGLNETFGSKGPVTVFAPNDQAFAKLQPGQLDTLLKPAHKYDLIALLTYHAIAGKITARNILHQINSHKGTATFTTLTGSKLTAKLDENRNIVLIDENGGQSIISRFDIQQNNGLIHIINSVLVPKVRNI